MPFGRNQWISAVPLKTLLNAVFPRTLTWHIGIVVQASGLSFFQFLAHSLPAPLIVILKCRLERHALRLWKSVSLCQPHHIIYFYILLYLHNRNFLQSPCNLKTQSLKEKCWWNSYSKFDLLTVSNTCLNSSQTWVLYVCFNYSF